MLTTIIREALRDAWAVLAPVDCAGCELPDRALCDACRLALEPAVTARQGPDGVRVHTAIRYEGVVRRVILQFKEHGRTDAADRTQRAPSRRDRGGPRCGPAAALVPIPSSRASYRRRGYDPVRTALALGSACAPNGCLRGAGARASRRLSGSKSEPQTCAERSSPSGT